MSTRGKVYRVSMLGNVFQSIPSLGNDENEPLRLVSVKRAADLLGEITPREVYNLFNDGELESVKLGRRRLVVVESIDAYVTRLRDAARAGRDEACVLAETA